MYEIDISYQEHGLLVIDVDNDRDNLEFYIYNYYIIDPSGNLFGNTQCGINNFLNYLVYSQPYNNSDPGHIDNL